MSDGSLQDRLRRLPAVDRIVDAVRNGAHRRLLVAAARQALDDARGRVRAGQEPPSLDELVAATEQATAEYDRSLLQEVINATGVLIHTNLGRVPLGDAQLESVRRVAAGYSNLEYDLDSGQRGSRLAHASRLLAAVTGAEAALVVNNNAAAVLLALAGICAGREVVISRGELVEIGGEFRIPEVMEIAGARLIEVGTTNRTHLADYEKAITQDTAAILKVHPSNYQMIGFTSSVNPRELVRLARGRGIAFINDLGSGLATAPGEPTWATGEPTVASAVAEGADLITFSGDKLMGGPQAGLIVGRAVAIEKLARHAIIRALRVDKMTLAAIEVTLDLHLQGRADELPLWRMAGATVEELERRGGGIVKAISSRASDVDVQTVATSAVTGGGSLPGAALESVAVALGGGARTPSEVERHLRRGEPPVIARVEGGRVLLDLRTVAPSDDEVLIDLVVSALGG